MNYETFRAEYLLNFRSMMAYKPNEVGSQAYAEKMAKMSDEQPEWVEQIEAEDE